MKKKALLLGGAGFIGLNIVKYLCENRNYEITIVDNYFRDNNDENLIVLVSKYNIKLIEGDLTSTNVYELLDKDYDYIYMLASIVGVDYTSKIPHELIRINGSIILNTLEWLKKASVGKVLFTSTSECYAGTVESFDYHIPTPEEVPLCISDISHPRFTYAVTKMFGESGFHSYANVFGFEMTIVRYHNVYGPRMGFKHVIPHLAQRFLKNEQPFKIFGHDQTRAFCYIDDAVEGTVSAMESENSDKQTYHIGTMEETTIENLVKESGKIMGFTGTYENAATYPGSVFRRCPDISKAIKELQYSPVVDLSKGLTITLKWYSNFLQSGKTHTESYYKK